MNRLYNRGKALFLSDDLPLNPLPAEVDGLLDACGFDPIDGDSVSFVTENDKVNKAGALEIEIKVPGGVTMRVWNTATTPCGDES